MGIQLESDLRGAYARFVERVAGRGEAWALVDDDRRGVWVDSNESRQADGSPVPVHLLFSDRARCIRHARDEWEGFTAFRVPIEALIELVLPAVSNVGERIGCDFDGDLAGYERDPLELLTDLREALRRNRN